MARRDDAVGEARRGRGRPRVELGRVRAVRTLRGGLSPRGATPQGVPPGGARGRAGRFPQRGREVARLPSPRRQVHGAVLHGGLHGVRPLRGELPGGRARRARDAAARGEEPRARPRGVEVLPHDPRGGRHEARHVELQRRPAQEAALRVLRRVRRLRRGAVHPPAHADLRRAPRGGERDGLLERVRRQPAHRAVLHARGRTRRRVGQLALRGQRRVRTRHARHLRQPRGARPRRGGEAPSRRAPAPRRRSSCSTATNRRRCARRPPA